MTIEYRWAEAQYDRMPAIDCAGIINRQGANPLSAVMVPRSVCSQPPTSGFPSIKNGEIPSKHFCEFVRASA